MIGLERDPTLVVKVGGGSVDAGKVVIATNAWSAGLPGLSRKLVVIGSEMAVTEPIADRLAAIGFDHGIGLSDAKLLLNFHRTTADHRVAFGKALGQLCFGGRVGSRYDGPSPRNEELLSSFRALYPALADVSVSTTWHGPIDRSYDGLPFFSRLHGDERVLLGAGFSGNGVGPAVIAGHILSALALGDRRRMESVAARAGTAGSFPPEPIRGLGGVLVRGASKRKDARDEQGRKLSAVDRTLLSFSPPGLAPVSE